MQAASSGNKSYHEKLEQFINTNQYRFLKQSIKGIGQPQAIIKTHFEDDEFFYLLDPMTDPILKKIVQKMVKRLKLHYFLFYAL
jgi:hypothetical protein